METTPTSLITEDEEIEKVFNSIDTNGDGRLSPTEISTLLSRVGHEPSADEIKVVMSELDVNGDGFVDKKEFKAFRLSVDDSCEDLRKAFDLFDKDGDEKITAEELLSVLRRLGLEEGSTVEECRKMIGAFDVDGDGCVDFEEFKKMMTGN